MLTQFRKRVHTPILLPFPVSPTLRVAQLSPGASFAGVETFIPKRWTDLSSFGANVIVGSFHEIERLMERIDDGGGSHNGLTVDRALVILTRFGGKPLNDVARVRLWQAFGVPLFEMYLGLDDSVLAVECEAHEGWHLAPGLQPLIADGELTLEGAGNAGLRTGLTAKIQTDICPCGLSSIRLTEIEQVSRSDGRYLAVTA